MNIETNTTNTTTVSKKRNRRLFAFGYKARVGKDTAAEYLIQKYGGKRFAFSGALYEIMTFAQKRCGFPISKDRQFLQYIGTEWARNQDKNVWVNILTRDVSDYMKESSDNVYVTDVRFPNEFESLKNMGFVMVQIKGDPKSEFGTGNNQHESEIALKSYNEDAWDEIIENSGTLESFYEKLDTLIKKYNN